MTSGKTSRKPAAERRLLIDMGNSRLKWCIARGNTPGRMRALPHAGRGLPELKPLLLAARKVSSVAVVSVAGQPREDALRATLRKAGLPEPVFFRSSTHANGLINGYREAWRLGADRWAAAIGAWHDAGRNRPVCVIDIGTATTVDVVDAGGRHLGGLIAPGPALMTDSLLEGTQGIAIRAQGTKTRQASGLARDTGTAIDRGARFATAALIGRAARDCRREHGRRTMVYLTGGGAASVLPLLDIEVRHCPDLVLRGLAVADV